MYCDSLQAVLDECQVETINCYACTQPGGSASLDTVTVSRWPYQGYFSEHVINSKHPNKHYTDTSLMFTSSQINVEQSTTKTKKLAYVLSLGLIYLLCTMWYKIQWISLMEGGWIINSHVQGRVDGLLKLTQSVVSKGGYQQLSPTVMVWSSIVLLKRAWVSHRQLWSMEGG